MEQVEAPQARHPDEGSYRLLLEAVTDYAIYMLDLDGRVASWNAGARRFKGYEANEIIGQHFSRFYTEKDRVDGLPARALATAESEGRFENEGWRVRKDGTRFWAHVVIDPIRDPAGRLVGYAKITRDLTERREAEDKLRRSLEQFRLLVQSVTDYAIYMIDKDGFISSWNAGAERIKGYDAEEIIGQHFSRFYTPEDRAAGEPAKALETAGREGRYEREGWRVRKDGTRFRASVIIDAITGDDGTLIGFAKITRDITERVAAQRALDEAREALAQSQKVEAIGQLTGGIAHDFNNLLTAILGSLTLVRKRVGDDAKVLSLLDNAIHGAERGSALVKRMLAFARRQELSLVAVDLPELVRSMKDLMQTSIGPMITIDIRFPPDLEPVRSDRHQLESALVNLVVNARDAMPNGGMVTISGLAEEIRENHRTRLKPGRYVCLSVADTGIGMDKATLVKAAEPFFTTKGIGKGTGLGLPMIQGLAEQSGGRLVLESDLGRGTTARIWLPSAFASTEALAAASGPMSASSPIDRRLTILAVDDDALVLLNTAALLEDLGHEVLPAASGAEALRLFADRPDVELVITDQAMPHMTGLQLARQIWSIRPDLSIILATGYAELPPDADPALARIGKPYGQDELERAIQAIMNAKGAV
ncbi:PAS domain S-box protein [Labrys okinawensis]|uniref:hybrid sensor histidine kinase/response regulator n=1 Tax=Labrys okinawensis TaxID=346911 RepID=UPI0039BD0916